MVNSHDYIIGQPTNHRRLWLQFMALYSAKEQTTRIT